MKRARLRITGVVQGVGFRWSLREHARSLGLAGWVANDPDGSVEAVVEGPDDGVASLVEWASEGPVGSRVENVDTLWEQPRGEQGFDVL